MNENSFRYAICFYLLDVLLELIREFENAAGMSEEDVPFRRRVSVIRSRTCRGSSVVDSITEAVNGLSSVTVRFILLSLLAALDII